jgi:Sigma 54 modulation protein / S30EA ribosomal protein
MQIQLNSDNHIVGSPDLFAKIEQELRQRLKHLANEVTRIEVHLNDENSIKGGVDDKRCLLEARVVKMKPISVEHHADTIDQAVAGAAEQLARALKSALEKDLSNNRTRESIKRLD